MERAEGARRSDIFPPPEGVFHFFFPLFFTFFFLLFLLFFFYFIYLFFTFFKMKMERAEGARRSDIFPPPEGVFHFFFPLFFLRFVLLFLLLFLLFFTFFFTFSPQHLLALWRRWNATEGMQYYGHRNAGEKEWKRNGERKTKTENCGNE